jgi:hypothetical protein
VIAPSVWQRQRQEMTSSTDSMVGYFYFVENEDKDRIASEQAIKAKLPFGGRKHQRGQALSPV